MKIKVHSWEKESNGWAVMVGGNTEAYDLFRAADGAKACSGPYVAFESRSEAEEHGEPFACYFCCSIDGYAIYHIPAE